MFENYCGASGNAMGLPMSGSGGPPRKPLRISRIIVLKSLGPQLIPFTQAACIYFVLFLPHDAVSAVACFIKCLPILSLIGFVILHGNVLNTAKIGADNPSTYSRWILVGLVCSALGDALLQLSAAGYFIPGMAAFGLAHVCYATAFGLQPVHPSSGVVMFALGGGVFGCLMPYLPGMFRYAVGVYFVLVVTMGWRAIARVPFLNDLWTWTKLSCAVGALLFCLSDLLIAVKMFYSDFPHSQLLIMTTYYVRSVVYGLMFWSHFSLGSLWNEQFRSISISSTFVAVFSGFYFTAQMGIAVSVVEGQLRPTAPSNTASRSPSPPPNLLANVEKAALAGC